MVKEKIEEFRDRIHTTHGVAAGTPVSRYGIIPGDGSGSGLTGPRSRAISAAIPAPGERGAGISGRGRLRLVMVRPEGGTVLAAGAGEGIFAAPVVRDTADPAILPADKRAAVQETGVTR